MGISCGTLWSRFVLETSLGCQLKASLTEFIKYETIIPTYSSNSHPWSTSTPISNTSFALVTEKVVLVPHVVLILQFLFLSPESEKPPAAQLAISGNVFPTFVNFNFKFVHKIPTYQYICNMKHIIYINKYNEVSYK